MANFSTEMFGSHSTINASLLNSSSPISNLNATEDFISPNVSSQFTFGNVWYYHPLRWTESVVAILGNTLVIAAVSRYPDLHTPTCSLIASLAMADLLTGCLMPLTAWVEAMARSTTWLYLCSAKEILYTVASYGNILNLTMVSIDRLICLTKPFWYTKHVTMSIALGCQGVMWAATFMTYVLLHAFGSVGTPTVPSCLYVYLLSGNAVKLFMVYPYYFFNLLIITNYIILAVLVWKEGRKVIPNVSSVSAQVLLQARHRKLTKVTGIVVGAYLLLTVPATIFSALVKETVVMMHLQYLTLLMWHMNSVINPFIYALRMPRFRVAFRKLLGLKSNAVGSAMPNVATVG